MATMCGTCEHLRPCLDGAYDWDDCDKGHDISRARRTKCPDADLRDDLMWGEIAERAAQGGGR